MIAFTFKLKRVYIFYLTLFIVFLIAMLFFRLTAQSTESTKNDTVNSDSLIQYIESFGYKINAEKAEITDITIPSDFNDVYTEYNNLQISQGYDLRLYKGVTVQRYTYPVLERENTYINIYVYNNKIIASDICSTDINGKIETLKSGG